MLQFYFDIFGFCEICGALEIIRGWYILFELCNSNDLQLTKVKKEN